MVVQNGLCCALTEINGLSEYSNPAEALVQALLESFSVSGETDDVVRQTKLFFGSIVIFTGATNRPSVRAQYAERFAQFIGDNDLGQVETIPSHRNENTKRYVTVYLWRVNRRALDAWWKDRPENPYDEEFYG